MSIEWDDSRLRLNNNKFVRLYLMCNVGIKIKTFLKIQLPFTLIIYFVPESVVDTLKLQEEIASNFVEEYLFIRKKKPLMNLQYVTLESCRWKELAGIPLNL